MDQETLTTLVLIAACAVAAPVLANALRRLRIPSVVLEIGLGILIGPFVLQWARPDDFVDGIAQLGLSFLMFLAGYEIELQRIKGAPLNKALAGWGVSLLLAFGFAAVLVLEGLGRSTLLIGLAMTTTALGTLLPIVRDAGVLETRFGAFVMGVGTVGEFGPIVAIAVLLTGSNPLGTTVLLGVFLAIALAAAFVMLRAQPPRWMAMLHANLHSSAQLPVRLSILLIVLLVWVAEDLGLDVLLGAFAAGMIIRVFTAGEMAEPVRTKLEAIGFGFLIPIFFIMSGMTFDLHALTSDASTLFRLPMFLLGFLLVRGIPVLLLYRRELVRAERLSLALFSGTQLPLVVVITTIGTESGRMLPANAAALVGAAMLSVLLYPLIGLGLLRRAGEAPDPVEAAEAHRLDLEP